MYSKELQRKRRHARIRSRLVGTATKPRLCVYRSLLYTYAQAIDDETNRVLVGMSDKSLKAKGSKVERAKNLGEEIGKKLGSEKIDKISFDRNGYKYHGRIKAVADGLREAGIKF